MATTPESPILFKANMIIKDPEELRYWLKGRKKDQLRVGSNAKYRTLAFADVSTAEYIVCDISAFVRNRDLYRRYIRLNKEQKKQQENGVISDGGMITKWISMMCSCSD